MESEKRRRLWGPKFPNRLSLSALFTFLLLVVCDHVAEVKKLGCVCFTLFCLRATFITRKLMLNPRGDRCCFLFLNTFLTSFIPCPLFNNLEINKNSQFKMKIHSYLYSTALAGRKSHVRFYALPSFACRRQRLPYSGVRARRSSSNSSIFGHFSSFRVML
jgi:hypothetical protein